MIVAYITAICLYYLYYVLLLLPFIILIEVIVVVSVVVATPSLRFATQAISQRLQQGSLFVLEGPGGSGKSVVSKALAKHAMTSGVLRGGVRLLGGGWSQLEVILWLIIILIWING